MTINGFLVVRLPQLNYLVLGRDIVPCINGIHYAGIDRQRWLDIFDEDFYAGHVPNNIRNLANTIKAQANDFSGIDLCQDADDALTLLNYSNRNANSNELIAVWASSLDSMKGAIQSDLPVEWLGYDFVRLGEWSLIAAGVFMYPQNYPGWIEQLNHSGLFDNCSLLAAYMSDYEQAVAQNRSEPLGPASTSLGTIAIKIGRVLRR